MYIRVPGYRAVLGSFLSPHNISIGLLLSHCNSIDPSPFARAPAFAQARCAFQNSGTAEERFAGKIPRECKKLKTARRTNEREEARQGSCKSRRFAVSYVRHREKSIDLRIVLLLLPDHLFMLKPNHAVQPSGINRTYSPAPESTLSVPGTPSGLCFPL